MVENMATVTEKLRKNGGNFNEFFYILLSNKSPEVIQDFYFF